ncbi:MAG: hypothetical protein ACYTGP_05395, partial [Planctomycetota bacterium]
MNGRQLVPVLAVAASAAIVTSAHAQSINIDFGSDFGTPDPTYGAAGQVGVWNTITTPTPWVPTTHPLVGLDGRELQATVTIMNNDDGGLNDSGTSGADEQLFDDGLWGLGDVV